MLITKITSSTRSECILDISVFLAHYFENGNYVFPNTLSLVNKSVSYKGSACFFQLVSGVNLTIFSRHQSPGYLSVVLQRNRGSDLKYWLCLYCCDTLWTMGSFCAVARRPVQGYSPAAWWEAAWYLRFFQSQCRQVAFRGLCRYMLMHLFLVCNIFDFSMRGCKDLMVVDPNWRALPIAWQF